MKTHAAGMAPSSEVLTTNQDLRVNEIAYMSSKNGAGGGYKTKKSVIGENKRTLTEIIDKKLNSNSKRKSPSR